MTNHHHPLKTLDHDPLLGLLVITPKRGRWIRIRAPDGREIRIARSHADNRRILIAAPRDWTISRDD